MHTESPSCSRKSFFAKLGGLLAAAGLAPSLLGKFGADDGSSKVAPVILRPEQRAVSRKEGSY